MKIQLSPRYTGSELSRCVNFYPEKTEDGYVLKSFPGLTLVGYGSTLTPCRQAYFSSTGQLFTVHGNQVYEWTIAGSRTARGSIATSSTAKITMTDNGYDLIIVEHGYDVYTVGLASGPPVAVVDANVPQSPVGCAYMNGMVIVGNSDGLFSVSQIDDATDWTPAQTAAAESSADKLHGLLVSGQFLYLLGYRTIEKWYPTGNADFPFERVSGASLPIGVAGQYAACVVGDGIVFVGSSDGGRGSVYFTNGGTAQRLSTPTIEALMTTSYSLSWDAYQYVDEGHNFVRFHNESIGFTVGYDMNESAWHEVASFSGSTPIAHRVHKIMNAFSDAGQYPYAFDRYHDGMWTLDPASNRENTTDIRRFYDFQAIGYGAASLVHQKVTLDLHVKMDEYVGNDLVCDCRLTWDGATNTDLDIGGGVQFSRTLASATGQYVRFQALRLGPSRRRYYRLYFTGPAARIIVKNIDLELAPGGR